ncbi:hypothetical protein OOK13_44685 [Streptomyces sp. NBC_00378]|uniref:hypothetical protein n=1 Tax=unclassified Streptomyces TaxID=2593676 RepID=UPI00225597EB|nr:MULTISPECIES: hypothetical protein [unclassified Streptomyces]MCX5115403.1 hypothetical protein [Streptomyces sp. NBC_00378]
MTIIELDVEIDPHDSGLPGSALIDVEGHDFTDHGISLKVVAVEEGHGFGVSEIVTIALSIAGGVASDVIASSLKSATRGVIRRVRSRRSRSDGSIEGITELIDRERREPPQTDSERNPG